MWSHLLDGLLAGWRGTVGCLGWLLDSHRGRLGHLCDGLLYCLLLALLWQLWLLQAHLWLMLLLLWLLLLA